MDQPTLTDLYLAGLPEPMCAVVAGFAGDNPLSLRPEIAILRALIIEAANGDEKPPARAITIGRLAQYLAGLLRTQYQIEQSAPVSSLLDDALAEIGVFAPGWADATEDEDDGTDSE